MKLQNIHIKSLKGVIAILALVATIGCEDNPSGVREASGPPQLDRVSLVNKDSTTTEGQRGVQYIIWGNNLAATRSVAFNGAEADINPALATEKNIIITVPVDAPYANAADSLVVTNPKGSASLSFKIMQPPPVIDNFTPKAAGAGDTVTITGEVFDRVDTVRFGDEETGKLAEILSSTPTEIKVKVPEGVVNARIYVITPGGEGVSEGSFGFKYIVYDDALHEGWANQSYTGTATFNNTEHVKRGTYSAQMVTSGGYGAFKLNNNETAVNLDGYSAIKVSIYAPDASERVQVVVNGDYDNGYPLTLTQGEFVDFTVPLSEVNNPSQLQIITIQDQTGQAITFYVDDLGLI